jgi:tetratricopeptide (TPR) repeat protein
LCRLTGNQGFEGTALRFIGFVHALRGRFELALTNIKAAMALPNRRSFSEHANYDALLVLHYQAGSLERAEFWADKLYAALQERSMPVFEIYFLANIARAKIGRGKLAEGQMILDRLLEMIEPHTPRSHLIITLAIVYGQLHLAKGNAEQVFDLLDERVDSYRQAGFLYSLAEELWLRGQALILLGQLEAARVALLDAKKVAEAREERVVLWQILAKLSELERASGNLSAAEEHKDDARAVVDNIAAHAGEFRPLFLDQPAVTKLLA